MSDPTLIAPALPAEDEPSPLGRPKKRRERLEFALPTINVIFLLMLYFLVAGTIVQKDELSFAPPETARLATERLPRPLLVIADDGTLLLDGQVVARSDLVGAARAALADPQHATDYLNLLAPARMSAAPFLEVIAALGAADLPLRVVTVPEAAEAAR